MKQKKILISIDWFLPGTNSGGPVRSYINLIETLKEDFKFYVITRDTDYCSEVPYASIESDKWQELSKNLSVYYISKPNLNKKSFLQVTQSVEYDIVLINGIYSWYFSILPLLIFKKSKRKLIISARGMLNPQAFTFGSIKKKLFLKIAIIFGLYKNVTFHATNEDEKQAIYKWTNAKIIKVAPNLPRNLEVINSVRQKTISKASLVCLSRISKEKGIHHILNALGQLSRNLEINLDIYGSIYQEEYWTDCEAIIKELPPNIKVKYKGILESDLVPDILSKYHFFTLLSEGENFGHSILEGMSSGCPIFISNNTPWRNLEDQKVGFDVDLKDVKKILNKLEFLINMNQETYSEWSKSAFNTALEFRNDKSIIEKTKLLFTN